MEISILKIVTIAFISCIMTLLTMFFIVNKSVLLDKPNQRTSSSKALLVFTSLWSLWFYLMFGIVNIEKLDSGTIIFAFSSFIGLAAGNRFISAKFEPNNQKKT